MNNKLIIELPLPNPNLSPNKKAFNHWAKTERFKKQDQVISWQLTLDATHVQNINFTADNRLSMIIKVKHKDNRRRDLDNVVASFKSFGDGICAALGIDDSQIDKLSIERLSIDKKNPGLIVEISVI